MTKRTKAERRRYQEEQAWGTTPDVRDIFLTAKMKANRKRIAAKVAAKLMGKKR